jgi:hypothetical protein
MLVTFCLRGRKESRERGGDDDGKPGGSLLGRVTRFGYPRINNRPMWQANSITATLLRPSYRDNIHRSIVADKRYGHCQRSVCTKRSLMVSPNRLGVTIIPTHREIWPSTRRDVLLSLARAAKSTREALVGVSVSAESTDPHP